MTTLRNGDIVLTGRTSQGLVSHAIRLGSKLRYGFKSPYTIWSHTAIVVDADRGIIAEAAKRGVVLTNLREHYDEADYAVIPTGVTMDPHDWAQVKAFVDSVLEARTKYGFVTFAGLTIYCLTGGSLCIQKAGTAICSGLVCDALTRAGYIWQRPPFSMMPSDIARHFKFAP